MKRVASTELQRASAEKQSKHDNEDDDDDEGHDSDKSQEEKKYVLVTLSETEKQKIEEAVDEAMRPKSRRPIILDVDGGFETHNTEGYSLAFYPASRALGTAFLCRLAELRNPSRKQRRTLDRHCDLVQACFNEDFVHIWLKEFGLRSAVDIGRFVQIDDDGIGCGWVSSEVFDTFLYHQACDARVM